MPKFSIDIFTVIFDDKIRLYCTTETLDSIPLFVFMFMDVHHILLLTTIIIILIVTGYDMFQPVRLHG